MKEMEEKKYSVIGKVEIGTDEYRDLIVSALSAEKDADMYRSDYWKEHSRRAELEKKIAELEKELDRYQRFVTSDACVMAGFIDFKKGERNDI